VKLLIEPYFFVVLGAITAAVLFLTNHSSSIGWVVLAALLVIAYLASYWRRSCVFNHVLNQVSLYANLTISPRLTSSPTAWEPISWASPYGKEQTYTWGESSWSVVYFRGLFRGTL